MEYPVFYWGGLVNGDDDEEAVLVQVKHLAIKV